MTSGHVGFPGSRPRTPGRSPPRRPPATSADRPSRPAHHRDGSTKPLLASGGLINSRWIPSLAASASASSPVWPWSTNATSTDWPPARWTAWQSAPTWADPARRPARRAAPESAPPCLGRHGSWTPACALRPSARRRGLRPSVAGRGGRGLSPRSGRLPASAASSSSGRPYARGDPMDRARHGTPLRTIQRTASRASPRPRTRGAAYPGSRGRQGATNAHTASAMFFD